MFWKLRKKMYERVVESNSRIKEEYTYLVDNNLKEHLDSPWKHWIKLLELNIHYRLLKNNNYLIKPTNKKKIRKPCVDRTESSYSKRKKEYEFAKELLKYDVISFDIFDTLILRNIDRPIDLFNFLEKEHGIFNFAKLRKNAEEIARINCEKQYGSRDANIYEIYKYIEKESGLKADLGVKTEFEMECNVCFANPYLLRVFNILKEQNKRIIIVSDMYLPKDLMEVLLFKCGYIGYSDLFISCDYRASKREGRLYEIIKEHLGNDKKYVHIGDNRISDISTAEHHGFQTIFYKSIRDIGNPYRSQEMSPLVGSAYRSIINSHLHATGVQYTRQYEYGFIYGGIYLLGYVNWIHNYVKKNNISKIIFLARDSDVVKDTYDRLYDGDTCYLYWGRLPSFKYNFKYDKYAFFGRNIQDRINRKSKISIGKLLHLIDLEFLKPIVEQNGIDMEEILNVNNGEILKRIMIDNVEEIESYYNNEAMIAKNYIKSVIGTCHDKVAIVDIGWKGTEPLNLRRLLMKWNVCSEVHCLMAGSYGNEWNVQDGSCNVYMFSQTHNVENMRFLEKNVSYYTLAVELFGRMRCEPRFKGFKEYNNDIKFQFETLLVENIYDQKQIAKGMEDFVKLYMEKWKHAKYMYNISGYDAYAPSKLLKREYKYLEKNFPEHIIELDAGDDYNGMRNYKQYIEENKF